MTKAKMDDNADGTKHKPAPAKPKAKLHLRRVVTEQAADGSLVHHHTYADHKDAKFPHPERLNMATSSTPEEAGQHVSDMFSQNGMSQGQGEPDGDEGAGAAQPAPAPQQSAPPQE